ncbi:MAG: cytochrome c [Saprospiraceae bacterium]|nr:cytochrome c [Saprospiraceae bacterium]
MRLKITKGKVSGYLVMVVLLVACGQNIDRDARQNMDSSPGDEVQSAMAERLIRSFDDNTTIDAGTIFKQRCALCHGIQGDLGVNGAGDLTTSDLPLSERVKIIYYGKNTMTPFGNILDDNEIVAVAKHVEKLR